MLYHVTNRKEVDDSVRFDLLVDGESTLQKLSYMEIFEHLIKHMAQTDRYRYTEQVNDEVDEPDRTGADLREAHQIRQVQIARMPLQPCVRCEGVTAWIGYHDIQPHWRYKEVQHTFFMQCRDCGYYVQVGFSNGDNWQTDSYQELMQNRNPWVRTAMDPFQRNGTLRVTSRVGANDMGRLNLDGHEFHCGEPISVYDQNREAWRDGRVEFDEQWYFIDADDRSLNLRQGMRAKRRGGGYAR